MLDYEIPRQLEAEVRAVECIYSSVQSTASTRGSLPSHSDSLRPMLLNILLPTL